MTDKASSAGALLGGVELGGTKVICVAGTGPDNILGSRRTATSAPGPTLEWVAGALGELQAEHGLLAAIGVASFGPIDLREGQPTFGTMLATPKPNWSKANIVEPLRRTFDVPIGIASDVEAAALAEGASGAARGAGTFVYVTVGTGIGAGVVSGGEPVRGLLHPEVGHIAVPRSPGDDFEGVCPFHGDCLEGMASGPAIEARWGVRAERLDGARREEALELEAFYLASGLRSIAFAFVPERIVVGGGVGLTPGLVSLVSHRLQESLRGYPGLDQFERPDFVVAASLGGMAGPAGALAVALRAHRRRASPV